MVDIEEVKRLRLGPNDILVLKIDGHLSRDAAERVKNCFADGFPSLANKILVIDKSTSLAIVEQESLG